MSWQTYLHDHQNRFVQELVEFVGIPSVSAKDEHFDDVVRAGRWVVQRLMQAGLENVKLMETDTHPVVYGDWIHAGSDRPTAVSYTHLTLPTICSV